MNRIIVVNNSYNVPDGRKLTVTLLDMLLKDVNQPELVKLEIGAWIRPLIQCPKCIFLDADEEALSSTEEVTNNHGKYIIAYAEDIPLEDNSVSRIMMVNFPWNSVDVDADKIMSEIKRIIKADGYIIICYSADVREYWRKPTIMNVYNRFTKTNRDETTKRPIGNVFDTAVRHNMIIEYLLTDEIYGFILRKPTIIIMNHRYGTPDGRMLTVTNFDTLLQDINQPNLVKLEIGASNRPLIKCPNCIFLDNYEVITETRHTTDNQGIYILSDAESIPLRNNSASRIVMKGFPWDGVANNVMSEIKRIIKPDGYIVICYSRDFLDYWDNRTLLGIYNKFKMVIDDDTDDTYINNMRLIYNAAVNQNMVIEYLLTDENRGFILSKNE